MPSETRSRVADGAVDRGHHVGSQPTGAGLDGVRRLDVDVVRRVGDQATHTVTLGGVSDRSGGQHEDRLAEQPCLRGVGGLRRPPQQRRAGHRCTSHGAEPKVAGDGDRRSAHHDDAASRSISVSHSSLTMPGSERRSAIRSRYQAQQPGVRLARSALRPVEARSGARRRGPAGPGRPPRPSRARRTPPPAPPHGLGELGVGVVGEELPRASRAPHSSPMNSIGVNGAVSSSAAPQASRPGERQAESRSPVGAVADLVVGLQRSRRSRCAGDARRVDRAAVGPAAEVEYVPSWKKPRRAAPCASAPRCGEVRVVALRLAGQRGVQRVVEVVGPLRVQPETAASRGGDGAAGRCRSDSAISHSGRPSSAASASTSRTAPPARCTARSSCSACTASSRRPSTWKSRSHTARCRRGTRAPRR